jgi:hypothetical protein
MVFEFKIVGKFRDEMLNFTRDGGTKRRRRARALAQQKAKRVRVIADNSINVDTEVRITLPPLAIR